MMRSGRRSRGDEPKSERHRGRTSTPARPRRRRSQHSPRLSSQTRAQRVLAFAVGAGLPLYLALNDGGYELVLRNQAALFLWWGLAVALAFGVLPVARFKRRLWVPLGCLAALVVWTALSMLWTDSQERTFDELARITGYAGLVALIVLAVHRETFRQAAAGLAVALAAIPVLSLASRLAPDLFPPDSIARLFAGDRLLYPLGYWNALACWSAMSIAMSLAWSAHARGWQRQAALALVPVAAVTLYLTFSRAGIVVAVLGVALVIAGARHRWTATLHAAAAAVGSGLAIIAASGLDLTSVDPAPRGAWLVGIAVAIGSAVCWVTAGASRRWGVDRLRASARPGRRLALGAGVIAIVVALAVGPRVVSRAGESFVGPGYASRGADPASRLVGLEGSRSEVWSSGVRAFASSPVTGIGPGTFELWWLTDVPGGEDLRDAHSLYLETLAELGVPGLLLLLAFLAGFGAAGLTARAALNRSSEIGAATGLLAAGAVFLLHAGVDWIWEMGAVAAVGLGALVLAASAGSERARGRRRLGGLRLAFVVAAVVAGAVQIPGLVAAERLRDSERLLVVGFEERAAELADEAIDAEPWAAGPRAQAAFVALAAGDLDDARAMAEAAIEREPTNWRHRFLLMRVELAARDREAASGALDETVRLNPSLADEASLIEESFSE
jgi:O-Antigen ligase